MPASQPTRSLPRRLDRLPSVLALAALALTGCASSKLNDPPGTDDPVAPYSCPQTFQACGGSLVGSWLWLQTCTIYDEACVGVGIVGMNEKLDRFDLDGTFDLAAGTDVVTVTTPAECFTDGAVLGGLSCGGASSRNCALNQRSDCVCVQQNELGRSTGTYVVGETTLTLNYGADLTHTFEYCVSPDASSLSIHQIDAESNDFLFFAAR